MNTGIRYIGIVICWLCFVLVVNAKTSDEILMKQYDETIFVISNFSGVDANLNEPRTIQELLDQKIGGFRFYLEWEKQQNQLMIKKADGASISFGQTMLEIKNYLENNPEKIFTLFLDFGTNVNELNEIFQDAEISQYLYTYDAKEGWPTLKSMLEQNRRLVVFSMQEHRNSPQWLHYIWNHAVEPYFSIWEAPVFKGEFLKGDPKNSLLIYNDYNFPPKSEPAKNLKYDTNQNPYLIEHVKNTWTNTGKTPNFIMLDRYGNWILGVLAYIRDFKTIKGTVTYKTQVLDYVNWAKTGSMTSGKYCFPVGPGDNLVLTPQSPGFRFTPETVTFREPRQNIVQYFLATPLEITDNLEGHYTFAKGSHDYSINGFNGKPENVQFTSDLTRSTVAVFGKNSYIVLPGAEKFKIRDHDFSVAAWVKIKAYLPNKSDYCILGTKNNSYQQGIHLLIRDKKPYFGFYNNDLQGKTILEAGQWYHMVWRYNKLSGEQAIFLNGKLDSRSLGHPAYKGRDNLYIGVAGFNWSSNMNGDIDDLSIWSRALGEEEIWQLSKEVIEIVPIKNIFILFPTLSWSGVILILMSLIGFAGFKLKNRLKKHPSVAEKIRSIDRAEFKKPESNYIQLFGDFKVLDKEGNEITSLFTPKLKQLFLIILLYSQRNKNGISTQELTDILWQGQSSQSAKNSRGVTIRKLRLILESLDSVGINFNVDSWSLVFGSKVYCDYVECLNLLKGEKIHNTDFNLNFYHIIQEGELFKGESTDWLDDFKGFIGNNIVDILLKFIRELTIEMDSEIILKLTDRILVTDPVNDQALAYKLKALVKQNNYNLARFTFDRFCLLYEEMYGEKYSGKFDVLISV
ncbi:MAG TPA: LamG-like jellyroll fold domain-containing protein [Prolixibacteraceae bacterium]|nr:LamG-like jellyroll fold domain-containing protein [Prolixibacteraceae bacterium]